MDTFLAGKTALVTGGTKGIGLAIAKSLLSAGPQVVICGRTSGSVKETVEALKPLGAISGIAADVGREEEVSKLFAYVDSVSPHLDILVNNAGIGIFKPVAELSPEEWRKTIETNLHSAFYCSHEAIPRLTKSKSGYIINISSLAGRNPFAGGAAYNASKFGMNALSEVLFLDHRNDNIRVTYIMPGSVDTGFGSTTKKAAWKIAPEDISELVITVLRMPVRTMVSRIEVRPSRPQKE